MNAPDFIHLLRALEACNPALMWSNGKTLAQAWEQCPRPEWMLWLVGTINVDRRLLTKAACIIAGMALPAILDGEKRPLQCLEVVERWCRGEATRCDVVEAKHWAHEAAATYIISCPASFATAAIEDAARTACAPSSVIAAIFAAEVVRCAREACRRPEHPSSWEADTNKTLCDIIRAHIPLAFVEAAAEAWGKAVEA